MCEYHVKTVVPSGKGWYHSTDTLEGFKDEGKWKELSEVRVNMEAAVLLKRKVKA